MQLLNVPLEGAFCLKCKITYSHAEMLVDMVHIDSFSLMPSMQLSIAEFRIYLEFIWLDDIWLTAWIFKVGSGQAGYLKVVHRWHWMLGCTPAMPLVQGVPGLGTQQPGCLLLLEVFDEGHGSVGTGQVVASCRSESNERKIFQDLKTEKIKPNRTDKSWLVIWKLIQTLTFQRHVKTSTSNAQISAFQFTTG